MILRPYQTKTIDCLRDAIRTNRTAMLQLPTGGGKTAIVSQIIHSAQSRGHSCWFIVPRNELLRQASEHFLHWKINHGIISAKSKESVAYNVHIVSKDTLIRRYDKIKNWPDLMIFDEAHLFLDRQKEIVSHLPDRSKIIGVTATPERLDGRGLSELYAELVQGPSIVELANLGYLSDIKYFSPPPPEELKKAHVRGTEYDPTELEKIFSERKVYGHVIDHYRKYAHKKPALVFCRSVKAAAETAQRFNDAGYRFENIDGRMSYKRRKTLIQALRDGKLDGLTSCELICYGLDVPRVECIIMLRPTLSRTLYFQMIGRGLRPYAGKQACIVLDHVGNLIEHGHPFEDYRWQFDGREKRKRKKGIAESALKLCPKCFLYYTGDSCPNCGAERDPKQYRPMEEVDGKLVEITGPIKLADRDDEERREIQDAINTALTACRTAEQNGEIDPGAVGELLKIADDIGRSAMWVYWRLSATYTDKDGTVKRRNTVNTPLLHEIKRQKGYANGWAWYKQKEIREKLKRHDSEIEGLRKAAGV